MNSAEFLRILRIDHEPGSLEVRIVADVRFGTVTAQAIIVIPYPDHRLADACTRVIGKAVVPEMRAAGQMVSEEYVLQAPDGEIVERCKGRIFPAHKREDYDR